VEVEAAVAQQPAVDLGGLEGLKVVEDHVHGELGVDGSWAHSAR